MVVSRQVIVVSLFFPSFLLKTPWNGDLVHQNVSQSLRSIRKKSVVGGRKRAFTTMNDFSF
jgi:hypothetical protein